MMDDVQTDTFMLLFILGQLKYLCFGLSLSLAEEGTSMNQHLLH